MRIWIRDWNAHTSCHDVLVLKHDALWRACRAGGVHDAAQVFWVWEDGIHQVILAELSQLLEAQDLELGMRILKLLDVGVLDLAVRVVYYEIEAFDFLERVDD